MEEIYNFLILFNDDVEGSARTTKFYFFICAINLRIIVLICSFSTCSKLNLPQYSQFFVRLLTRSPVDIQ